MLRQDDLAVAIYDLTPDKYLLSFDLKDILVALGERIWTWQWCITELDALGHDIADLCRRVDTARPLGTWMPAMEFVELAQRITQTIDGMFWALPFHLPGSDLGYTYTVTVTERFLDLHAEVAIEAVDSTFFAIYARDQEIIDRIQSAFSDVRPLR